MRRAGRVVRVVRVSRVVADLERAEAFYRGALGFHTVARAAPDATVLASVGLPGARGTEAVMRLGDEEIALVCLEPRGAPYPAGSQSNDGWFQHLAIVVADMDAARARVASHGGAMPISEGGSQTLPPANGGVRAWKFRDPDGHPLELLWFPPGQGRAVWHGRHPRTPFLGIDHSALAVRSAARSLRFYRALGFGVTSSSLNAGPAQSRLDGLAGARLSVFGLRAAAGDRPEARRGLGLELLAYRPPGRPATFVRAGDIAADWTILARTAITEHPRCIRDPDGHRLVLTAWAGR